MYHNFERSPQKLSLFIRDLNFLHSEVFLKLAFVYMATLAFIDNTEEDVLRFCNEFGIQLPSQEELITFKYENN